MGTIFRCPIVGAHFRPPAKLILAVLPMGCELLLEPEPENQYDARAIKVLVTPDKIPESQHEMLRSELPGMGFSLEDILALDFVFLGYCAAAKGKPFEKAKAEDLGVVGNDRIGEIISTSNWSAKLGALVSGGPAVVLTQHEEESDEGALDEFTTEDDNC